MWYTESESSKDSDLRAFSTIHRPKATRLWDPKFRPYELQERSKSKNKQEHTKNTQEHSRTMV